MEKRPDSLKKVLQKRIEELEQKLRSFEQGMRALQGELEGLKEIARTAEEETPPLAPAAEQPHVTAAPQGEFEFSLPDSFVEPDAAFASEEQPEKITPPPLPKTGASDETTAKKEPPTLADHARALPPEETAPSGAGAGEEAGMDLETRIGAIWFNRLGLVALVIGFALLGRYITPHLQPWHKVLGSYFAAALLFCCGWYFEQRLKQFARPVMAGAFSIAFFISFAAHFVKPMACIPLWGSLLLMSVSIGLIFLCAERWRSRLWNLASGGRSEFIGGPL